LLSNSGGEGKGGPVNFPPLERVPNKTSVGSGSLEEEIVSSQASNINKK